MRNYPDERQALMDRARNVTARAHEVEPGDRAARHRGGVSWLRELFHRGYAFMRSPEIKCGADLMPILASPPCRDDMLTSSISPYRTHHERARVAARQRFQEIYVKADLAMCERAIPRACTNAHRGENGNFTGISSPYEPPSAAELTVETDNGA
jgi:bifunctional enzyme CysN/CysC